jgi:hypothetical protein
MLLRKNRRKMYVMKKSFFVIAFTIGHAYLTLFMISWGRRHRPASSVLESLYSSVVAVLMCPVVLPLVFSDPDGDQIPRWIQWSSYFVNGMIWAAAFLILFAIVKRLSGNTTIANTTIQKTGR